MSHQEVMLGSKAIGGKCITDLELIKRLMVGMEMNNCKCVGKSLDRT